MEYEQGESLEQALKSGRIGDEASIRRLIASISGALHEVHTAGFIHRDIKPDNIYLRQDGTPVLLDFGSARQALGTETQMLTALVSPGYAPFEQYDSSSEGENRQGPWTDIYAMGAVLYRIVTGNVSVDAINRMQALMGDPDPLMPAIKAAPTGYSPALLNAIDAALVLKPTGRPRSLDEWMNLFEEGVVTEVARRHQTSSDPAITNLVNSSKTNHFNEAQQFEKQQISEPVSPIPTYPNLPTERIDEQRSGARKSYALVAGIVTGAIGLAVAASVGTWYVISTEHETDNETQTVAINQTQPEADNETPTTVASNEKQTSAKIRAKALVADAQVDIQAYRLITPAGNNALEKLRQALQIDPLNQSAQTGIDTVAEKYLHLVGKNLKAGELANAEKFIELARSVRPKAPGIVAAMKSLQTAKDKDAAASNAKVAPVLKQTEEQPHSANSSEIASAPVATTTDPTTTNPAPTEAAKPVAPKIRRFTLLRHKVDEGRFGYNQSGHRLAKKLRAELMAALSRAGWVSAQPGNISKVSWVGSFSYPEPDASEVKRYAAKTNIDGAVATHICCPTSSGSSEPPLDAWKIRIFMVSKDGSTIKVEKQAKELSQGVRTLISRLEASDWSK